MKPRIRLIANFSRYRWCCMGESCAGFGHSPLEAFVNWLRAGGR